MTKRQVDALTIKAGPAEDGLLAPAPSATPLAQAANDFTTYIVVGIVIIAVAVVSLFLYMRKRKKSLQTK